MRLLIRSIVVSLMDADVQGEKRGYARDWPARQTWTFDRFAMLGESTDVPISVSLEESGQTPTRKQTMLLGDYIRRYVMAPRPGESAGDQPSAWGTPPYLKQFDLLSAFPKLSEDLLPVAGDPGACPSAVFPPSVRHLTYWAWLGAPSSVTGLHSDDEDNILVMLQGWKQVVVIPPSDAPFCYINDKFDSGTECCDACPVSPNLDEFPEFAYVRRFLAVLGPGDALVLPIGWFHHVTSLSPSVSLNIFASTTWQWIRRGAPRALAQGLHGLGLYKSSHCVCHDVDDGAARKSLWARLCTVAAVVGMCAWTIPSR